MDGDERRDQAIEAIEIDLLLEAVYRQRGRDFRSYASASIRRRLLKRLAGEGLTTMSELQERVLHAPDAMERLLDDLSIAVTGMFRDPTFFLSLRRHVVPVLRTYPFVRIWHTGCATGEEVYSLAILLEEEDLADRARVYATDMSDTALDGAREGVLAIDRMRDYSARYFAAGGKRSLADYYTARSDTVLVAPRLRRNVLFSHHDLALDAPFNEFHLILCRNVLMYFDGALQRSVHALLAASLAPLGFLCVGRHESLRFSSIADALEEVDPVERIYRARR